MAENSLKKLLMKPTLEVARGLLGCTLTTRVGGRETSGIIVETEAYHGDIDEASHCYRKRTARNEAMFGRPGTVYVYFIYGMHYCLNIVTEAEDTGAAVLIRAIEPSSGIDVMQRRRHSRKLEGLANGPGKLCKALGIDKKLLGEHILESQSIAIEMSRQFRAIDIGCSSRIGISRAQDLPWRFFINGNKWVSCCGSSRQS